MSITKSPFLRRGRSFYVIAEASGNHAQSLKRAHALIDAAAEAGADAIKFQTFTAEEIAADHVAILRGYNAEHDAWLDKMGVSTMRELFRKGGLPRPWHKQLKDHATERGIDFLSTPFSVDAARFLVEEIGVPYLKIASGDLTFLPLLEYANTLEIPVILSTGGATPEEISAAATIHLARQYLNRTLALLHCRSVYPCPEDIVQLHAIRYLAQNFPYCTPGWSDHTLSWSVPGLALCVGAVVIEKHLTLDDEGVDAGHSLRADGFARMVNGLIGIAHMLGEPGTKTVHLSEYHDRLWARRAPEDWRRPTMTARMGQWE